MESSSSPATVDSPSGVIASTNTIFSTSTNVSRHVNTDPNPVSDLNSRTPLTSDPQKKWCYCDYYEYGAVCNAQQSIYVILIAPRWSCAAIRLVRNNGYVLLPIPRWSGWVFFDCQFHVPCTGLKQVPKSNWFCNVCNTKSPPEYSSDSQDGHDTGRSWPPDSQNSWIILKQQAYGFPIFQGSH